MKGVRRFIAITGTIACGLHVGVIGQLSVRPDDPLGLSLRTERLRLVHSTDPLLQGGTLHIQRSDPWLLYALGAGIFQREWGHGDAVFASLAQGRRDAAAVTSCAMCHNLPFRSAGSGGNVADPGAFGRNVPHLFGVGLIEMIGEQVRAEILAAHDRNRNGFLDVPLETAGARAVVEPVRDVRLDLGALDDLNGDGFPGLNELVQVTFVGADGRPVTASSSEPVSLRSTGVAGYDIVVAPFGGSISDHQLPTVRAFAVGVMRTVMGLQVEQGTFTRAGDGLSNAGALQPVFPLPASRPCGNVSSGEIDALEWMLLNQPAPAVGLQSRETERGEQLLSRFGCTSCHVPEWEIRPARPGTGYAGDRRFFALDVAHNAATNRLEGQLRVLAGIVENAGIRTFEPRRVGARVRGVFSDFRHHDVGERFYEYTRVDEGLAVTRRFRTTPLWGVGSTAPYGHDGRSPTLDAVIRRHGGDAESSAANYARAPRADRAALVSFLRSLVLYQPDTLPVDLDGDGRISDNYRKAGKDLGPERLAPELLFRVVPSYRGWHRGPQGEPFFSYALLNAAEMYGRARTSNCSAIQAR